MNIQQPMLNVDLNSLPELSVCLEKKVITEHSKNRKGSQRNICTEKKLPAVKSTHTNLKRPPVNYRSTSPEINVLSETYNHKVVPAKLSTLFEANVLPNIDTSCKNSFSSLKIPKSEKMILMLTRLLEQHLKIVDEQRIEI